MMESNISSSLFYNLLGSWALFLKKCVLFCFIFFGRDPLPLVAHLRISLSSPPPTIFRPLLLLLHFWLDSSFIILNSSPSERIFGGNRQGIFLLLHNLLNGIIRFLQLAYGHVGNLQDREKWSCQNPAAMKWQVWLGSHTSVSPTTFQCQSKGTAYRWLVHKHKNK
jgi:hypothetical protein